MAVYYVREEFEIIWRKNFKGTEEMVEIPKDAAIISIKVTGRGKRRILTINYTTKLSPKDADARATRIFWFKEITVLTNSFGRTRPRKLEPIVYSSAQKEVTVDGTSYLLCYED